VVIIVSVYLASKAFKEGKTKKLIFYMGTVPIYLVGMFLVMTIFQTVFVSTNELDKEKSYIEANIEYTKNAYGIHTEEINLDGDMKTITSQEISQYENVLNNITIANKEVVLKDLKKDHTVLIITHKPSLMKIADDLIVIDHGKLVGRGKHKDLIENNEYYKILQK